MSIKEYSVLTARLVVVAIAVLLLSAVSGCDRSNDETQGDVNSNTTLTSLDVPFSDETNSSYDVEDVLNNIGEWDPVK